MAKSKKQKERERERREKNKTDHWLVVQKPWFRDYYKKRASLTHLDLGDVLWWLSVLLRCNAEKIGSLQHQTNKTFIIAKVDLDVDVRSRLGEYKWKDFLARPSDTEKEVMSQVLEYNYLEFGDPSENQWKEDFPELPRRPPSQFFVRKFPDPTWCERPRIEPISWCVSLPNADRSPNQGVSGSRSTTGTTEAPVSQLSRPILYSAVNSNMTSLSAVNSSSFQPYQPTLRQFNLSSANNTDEQKEPLIQSQLIQINNPYGVRWLDTDRPDFSGIWNWLQLIVDRPQDLYADIVHKWVIVRIGGHVDLNGVLGRHVWRSFLNDCPSDALGEESLITRTDEDKTQGLLKVNIPEVDEDYDAFVPAYPYPEAFMHEEEELKDVKDVKPETKEQVKKKEEELNPFIGSTKREWDNSYEEEDRKRVKLE